MTIQKAKELLERSNPSVNEIQRCLKALMWDRQYVQNSITLGIRNKESGQENIDELSDLIEKLQEKLECITS